MMNSILKKITLFAIFLTFFVGISIDQNQNLDASNNFEIILTIDEGEKYTFGDIDVESKLEKLNSDFIKNSINKIDSQTF